MKDDSPVNVLWLPTIAALAIAYVASMIDLLPDALIGIGWLDDLAVVIGLIWFFTSWLPKNRHRIYWFKPHQQAETQDGGESPGEQDTRDAEREFDPYQVLNVRREASAGEIKRAYREMLAKYHPDKVIHLGKEFQQLAHDKAIEITRAYEMLCGKG